MCSFIDDVSPRAPTEPKHSEAGSAHYTSRYTTNYDLASSPGSRRRGSPGRRVLISTSKRDAMLTNSFSQSRSITYLEPLRVQIQTTRSSSEISPVQPGLLQLEKNYTIRAQKRRKNKKDYVDEFIFPISFRLRALEPLRAKSKPRTSSSSVERTCLYLNRYVARTRL
jgi:hypothetical protein